MDTTFIFIVYSPILSLIVYLCPLTDLGFQAGHKWTEGGKVAAHVSFVDIVTDHLSMCSQGSGSRQSGGKPTTSAEGKGCGEVLIPSMVQCLTLGSSLSSG